MRYRLFSLSKRADVDTGGCVAGLCRGLPDDHSRAVRAREAGYERGGGKVPDEIWMAPVRRSQLPVSNVRTSAGSGNGQPASR